MSVKRGLVGFGLVTALAAGSFYSIDKAFETNQQKAETVACKDEVPSAKCVGVLATKSSIDNLKLESEVYGWIGGVGMIAAAFGGAVCFIEVMDDSENAANEKAQTVPASA